MEAYQRGERARRDQILERLRDFPHTFQLQDVTHLPRPALRSLQNHLQAALKAGYATPLETARTCNLLAFVLFQLEERDAALRLCEDTLGLEGEASNVVALANKAVMLCREGEEEMAEEVVAQLEEARKSDPDFPYLLVKARAEQAASYMRLGPRFNHHAAQIFREVIQDARLPEMWTWKFGLAVTHRHALDLQYAPHAAERADTVTHHDALQLLQDVLGSQALGQEDEARDRNLKANAHAEMALLLRSTLDETTKKELGLEAHSGPMASCKKALQLDDNDPSVLWKTGKLFRNYKDLFRSRKLLEKAVALQPSSAAYHHLGLTYKAMATNAVYGKLKTRRGGRRAHQEKRAREEKQALACQESTGPKPQQKGAVDSKAAKLEKQIIDRVKKVVKDPKDTTEFDPKDHNVKLAVENLQKAVDFSCKENSRALYDLALMYKGVKDYPQALKHLKDIQKRRYGDDVTPSGCLEQITALDQMGLIYKEISEHTDSEQEKARLAKDSEKMFYRALTTAAQLYSTTEAVRHIFGKIFHSPSALLKAADSKKSSPGERLKSKAEILKLINKHKETQALLAEMGEEEHDEHYYLLKLQTDAASGEPEKAAACLAMLRPTELYGKVRRLCREQRDVHVVHDVHLQAGRKALLGGDGPMHYFSLAFREVAQPPPEATETQFLNPAKPNSSSSSRNNSSSSSNNNTSNGSSGVVQGAGSSTQATGAITGSTEEPGDDHYFDVMLLHDEEDEDIERKAKQLEGLLGQVLGLRVVRGNDNYLPGTRELSAVLHNMDHSRLVLVLPGKQEMLPLFEQLVTHASERRSTALLMTEGVTKDRVPRELKMKPQLACPPELFADDVSPEGPHNDVTNHALCRLFELLTDSMKSAKDD